MRGRREKVVSSRKRGGSIEGSADWVTSSVLLMSSVNTTAKTTSKIAAKFGNLIKIPQIQR